MLVCDMPAFRARRLTVGSLEYNRLRFGLVVRAPDVDVIRTPDGREVRPLCVGQFQDQSSARIKSCLFGNPRPIPRENPSNGEFQLRVWRAPR